LLRARGSWREQLSATIRWFAALRRAEFRCADGATVADIIAPLPPHVRDNLWAPLCVAALNTPPTEASAQVFLNVLREAFGGAANAAQMVVARSGLAAAFPKQAADWLRARGHAVGLSSRLRVIDADDIRLADATGTRRADAAVVAVGPHQLATAFDPTLATGDAAVGAALRQVAALAWQPIVTAYLGYEASVALPRGLVRLDDSPGQWLFDRGDILRRAAASPSRPELGSLLSVVISAHGDHDALDQPAFVAAIDSQLRRLRPSLPRAALVAGDRRKACDVPCVPATAHPQCGRLTGRVYLAGDYTYPAFPATLEAAVRSGVAAARAVIADVPQ
jgi:hypothetical protein